MELKTVTLALLLVLSLVTPVATVSADEAGVTAIDANHGLDDKSSIEEFKTTGSASASRVAPELTITVAESKDAVGVDGITPTDAANDFIRIQYDEDISRDIRVHIPAEYFGVYTRANQESVSGDYTAEVRPVKGGSYLSVTVSFDESGTAVIPVPKEATFVSSVTSSSSERIQKVTGVSAPSTSEYQYVEQSDLSGDGVAYALDTSNTKGEAIVEYYKDGQWKRAPYSDDGDTPVYVLDREGEEGTLYIIPTTTDPPEVRYKVNATMGDKINSALSEIQQLLSDLI